MLCLDSTFLIDLLKKKQDAVDKFNEIRDQDLLTTQLNIYEIKSGIYRKFDKNVIQRELNVFNNVLPFISMLSLDAASIDKAAEISGELMNQGSIIQDIDILIAGICLVNNCKTIITKDVKHFSRIKGLKVETY